MAIGRQCCNAGNIFSKKTTVAPPCNTTVPYSSCETVFFGTVVGLCGTSVNSQHVPLLSVILILVLSQSTMTTQRLPLTQTKAVHRIDLSPLVSWRNY